jgi:hypothetical protein
VFLFGSKNPICSWAVSTMLCNASFWNPENHGGTCGVSVWAQRKYRSPQHVGIKIEIIQKGLLNWKNMTRTKG